MEDGVGAGVSTCPDEVIMKVMTYTATITFGAWSVWALCHDMKYTLTRRESKGAKKGRRDEGFGKFMAGG